LSTLFRPFEEIDEDFSQPSVPPPSDSAVRHAPLGTVISNLVPLPGLFDGDADEIKNFPGKGKAKPGLLVELTLEFFILLRYTGPFLSL